MVAVFALCVLVTGDIYYFNLVVPEHWFGRQFGVLLGADAPLSDALVTGILLAHFWFDSVIWRLKNPESRAWVTRRYSFLFT
jgi:hypothetical protein